MASGPFERIGKHANNKTMRVVMEIEQDKEKAGNGSISPPLLEAKSGTS